MIVGALMMFVVGVLMSKSSRFTRPEKEGNMVTWFKVNLGDTATLNIGNILVGSASSFVEHFGYNLPERHVKDNKGSNLGMLVNLVNPIVWNDWELQSMYFTQASAIYDTIELFIDEKWANADIKVGKGTKADPERVLQFETWTSKDGIVVSFEHKKGQGNRTKYSATGGQESL